MSFYFYYILGHGCKHRFSNNDTKRHRFSVLWFSIFTSRRSYSMLGHGCWHRFSNNDTKRHRFSAVWFSMFTSRRSYYILGHGCWHRFSNNDTKRHCFSAVWFSIFTSMRSCKSNQFSAMLWKTILRGCRKAFQFHRLSCFLIRHTNVPLLITKNDREKTQEEYMKVALQKDSKHLATHIS